MLQDVFYAHLKQTRSRRTGSEKPSYGRFALPNGFRHALDSEWRIFSIIIHPTCRLNPSFVFTASIGALLESFQVLMVRYPFFFPNSMTFSFSAVAMPRPRYSRVTPVSSWFSTRRSVSIRCTLLIPT